MGMDYFNAYRLESLESMIVEAMKSERHDRVKYKMRDTVYEIITDEQEHFGRFIYIQC
ncbi:MAG: hypothetical protein K0R54_1083 [Clostridiaceae bacterium]|jgi:hypothetical protein|nr:hypothetical protein [Clostridiaceae bacterium]